MNLPEVDTVPACAECNGAGYISVDVWSPTWGHDTVDTECEGCGGSGEAGN